MILHKILTFFLILIQIITIGFCRCPVSISTVKYVSACPKNKEEWERASLKKNCSSITQNCTAAELFQYHCLLTPFLNSTVEVCAERRIIIGYCAEYNFVGERVQDNYYLPCLAFDPPCPTRYNSTDAYKYTECYKNASTVGNKEKTNSDREEKEKPDTEMEDKDQTDTNKLLVALVLSIGAAMLLIGIASVIAYKYSRCSKYRGCRQQGTETRGISKTVRDSLIDDQKCSLLTDKPEGPFSQPDKGCGNQQHSEHLDTDGGSADKGGENQRHSEHLDTDSGSEDTEEECFFYETETYKTAYNMLQNQDILVFDGLSGTGKTFTAKHLLHELKSKGFTPIKCQVPEDLTKCAEKSGKLVLFVDDLFNCRPAERMQWLEKLDNFLNLLKKECCNESVSYRLIATVKTSLREIMLKKYNKRNFLHIMEDKDGKHLVSFDVKLSKNEMKGILEYTAKSLHCAVPNYSEKEWENLEGGDFPFGFPLFAKLIMIPQKFCYDRFVSDPSAYMANLIEKAVEKYRDMLPLFYLLTIQEIELTNKKRVYEVDLGHEEEYTQLLSSYSSTLGKHEWSHNGSCLARKFVDYFFKFGKGESKFHFIHESVRDTVLKYLLTNSLSECVEEFPLETLCSEWKVCPSRSKDDVTISIQKIAERLISALQEKEDFNEICSFSIFEDKTFLDIFFKKDKKLNFLLTATDERNKYPVPYWFAFHGSTMILEKIIDFMKNEEGGMEGKKSDILFFILAGLFNSDKELPSIEWIENMLSTFCIENILSICFWCISKQYCENHCYLLDLACSNCMYNKDIVRFLLIRGAKFFKSTWNGWNFLRSAAEHGDDQFLSKLFLQKVKKFNIENYNKNAIGKSPEEIIHEFHKEDSFLINLATKCEPKIHLSMKTVEAALSLAELNKSNEPKNILSSCNDRGETILHVIVKSANNNGSTIEDAAKLLEYLKNQNVCQDVLDIDKNTPLMIELSKPDPDLQIIEFLLSCTRNVNLPDTEDRNLLHIFFMKQRTTKKDRLILELLIRKGVYSKHRDQNKEMPHDYALRNKCSTPIKCYLNRN